MVFTSRSQITVASILASFESTEADPFVRLRSLLREEVFPTHSEGILVVVKITLALVALSVHFT